jgi:hypothetical protein
MSEKPTYTFLPWSRFGVANSIAQGDGDDTVKVRATIPVDVTLATELVGGGTADQIVHKDIQLYGPGDIVGIDGKAIVRCEPQNWITCFESNLFAYAEFHDPDFPWRYTPAAATAERLRPWLAVVVLAEDEFEDVQQPGRPLPCFKLATGKTAAELFPPPAELWAWAHVHVNRSLAGTTLDAVLDADPDLATGRILCPRHLAANKTYHAFVIPTFESGRLAGLGSALPADLVATKSAWADGQGEFPYYHRWRFRTGFGDFEYLVRLLVPQPADKRVGVRDMDVLHPGAPLPPIDLPPEIQGVLKLGGALRVPRETMAKLDRDEIEKFENWADDDNPAAIHPFETAMAAFVNLADDYTTGGDPDPVITPPLYGRWHALMSRLLDEHPDNWVNELNLDPQWRVPAGIGTRVIQQHQEKYMNAAWQQVGDVLAANRLLELARLARAAGSALYRKHLKPLDASRRMQVTSPVQRRVISDGRTVRHAVEHSLLPYSAIAPAFRAMTRSRGRIARRAKLSAPGASARLVAQLDDGKLVVAAPWGTVGGAITVDTFSNSVATTPKQGVDPALRAKVAKSLAADALTPAAVLRLPKRPDFVAKKIKTTARALADGVNDSEDATRLKTALGEAFELISDVPTQVKKPALGVAAVANQVVTALDPAQTVPKRFFAGVKMPARILDFQVEPFTPAMVYPEFDTPMYEPLAAMSAELFLPNINLIPNNSLTLLQNNQRFIESYMTGLNHEMARELLWREYPTDQRGSYFRQFWDVTSVYPGNPPPADLREELRDIKPIHTWGASSKLGHHNQREPNPAEMDDEDGQLVLVIRGELLKRYPNTVIYAVKAKWAVDDNKQFLRNAERELVLDLDELDLDDLPKAKVRTPLYEARVKPDIFFVGFDLNAAAARGALPGEPATASNAGWFFVLQERPGEPRFGVDVPTVPGGEPTSLVNWNSLDWGDIGTPEGAYVKLDQTIELIAWKPSDEENKPDPEDAAAQWNPDTTAAQLAYILYQVPVLVAVHAHRMLP